MSDSDIPWRPQPTGPVYCPQCRRAVADATPGEHACGCGAREDGCGPGARLRARLGDVLRDVDDLAAERDAAVEEAARLRADLGAALLRAARWKRAAKALRRDRDLLRAIAARASK